MADHRQSYPGQGDDEDFSPQPWHRRVSENLPSLIGAIILVVIVVWGLIHLVQLAQPWFSSLVPKSPAVQTTVYPSPVLTNTRVRSVATSSIHTNRLIAHMQAAPPDLTVHILGVGVIDPATGQFVNRAPASPSDVAAVQFDVANDGGSSTGPWYFDATIPTSPAGYPYGSPEQESLGPGDHIVNTLRFSPIISGGGPFNVIVDSQGMVDESDETNNTATVFVPMQNY